MPKPVLLGALLLSLAACAGRAPNPVAAVQERDRHSDCATIQAEITANNQQIAELAREGGAKVAQNVAAGVAGLFIPVLWFAMDFQNAAGREANALEQRNAYLVRLAETRCAARS